MTTLVTLIVLLAVIGLIAAAKAKNGSDEKSVAAASYYKKKPLSQTEQALYYKLRKALPQHNVLAQVSLTALVGIKKGNGWQTAFNKSSRKYADFVICSPAFEVLAVIELDDNSHDTERAGKADQDKDFALSSAGHQVIRWRQKDIPSVEAIADLFSAESSHPISPPALR